MGLCYMWPMDELVHNSVSECVEQIHRAYQEPYPALLEAMRKAEEATQMGMND